MRRRGILESANIARLRSQALTGRWTARRAGFPPSIRSWRSDRRPVHRGTVRAHRGGTGEQHRLFNADGLFSARSHQFVVDVGAMVVHFLWFVDASNHCTSVGMRSPKSVFEAVHSYISTGPFNLIRHTIRRLAGG